MGATRLLLRNPLVMGVLLVTAGPVIVVAGLHMLAGALWHSVAGGAAG